MLKVSLINLKGLMTVDVCVTCNTWASVALLYPAKGIKADTPLAKYYHAAIINTLILGRSARGPRTNVEGAIPRAGPSLGG